MPRTITGRIVDVPSNQQFRPLRGGEYISMSRDPSESDASLTEEAGTAASAALALWAQSGSRRVAAQLVAAGVPVMVLKGPDLQLRLFGTPAGYPSDAVEVLVPRRLAARARRVLVREGWRFEQQGMLWRTSAAAS